jgi:hypothetical protein
MYNIVYQLYVYCMNRDFIEVGVNVTASKKKNPLETFESVRVAGRIGQAAPTMCTNLGDMATFCFFDKYHHSPVLQKSSILPCRCGLLPELPHFCRKFTSFFICFIRIRIKIDRPHAYAGFFRSI